jgi:hypothetical protein
MISRDEYSGGELVGKNGTNRRVLLSSKMSTIETPPHVLWGIL